jgi:hypothetical protein
MTTATLDPATRVKTLIALTEELTAIITRENELLNARRPKEISALQPDKARLAAAYAQSIRHVAADRSSVSAAGEGLIAKLKEITKTFEERARHQRALLDGARAASESIVRAVAEEGGRTAEPGYGPARAAMAPIVVDDKA